MGTKVLILIFMVFCHIVDDYYLQGRLASAKQKSWWEQNTPDEMFKNDYLMALFMHCFSWSFMVMLPLTIYTIIIGGTWYPVLFIVNIVIHFMTDNAKANLKKDKSYSRSVDAYNADYRNLVQSFMSYRRLRLYK